MNLATNPICLCSEHRDNVTFIVSLRKFRCWWYLHSLLLREFIVPFIKCLMYHIRHLVLGAHFCHFQISFGVYSAEQCKEMWGKIQKRLRRFRLLREVLEDAKAWVSKPWTNFYRSQKQVKNCFWDFKYWKNFLSMGRC